MVFETLHSIIYIFCKSVPYLIFDVTKSRID